MPPGTFFFEFGECAQLELGFGLELDLLLLLYLFSLRVSCCPAVLCPLLSPANKPMPAMLRRPRTTTHKLGCARPLACPVSAAFLASTSTSTTSSKTQQLGLGRQGGIRSESGLTNPVRREARAGPLLKNMAWNAQSRIHWNTGPGLKLPRFLGPDQRPDAFPGALRLCLCPT